MVIEPEWPVTIGQPCGVSGTTVSTIATGYALGLLKRCTSVQDMVEKGFLPVGRHQTCRHWPKIRACLDML